MPKQELFFEQESGGRRIEVLKTYDRSYAREVFNGIGTEAREALAAALELTKNYEPVDIPDPNGSDYDDLFGTRCVRPLGKMCEMTPAFTRSLLSPKPLAVRPRSHTFRRTGPAPKRLLGNDCPPQRRYPSGCCFIRRHRSFQMQQCNTEGFRRLGNCEYDEERATIHYRPHQSFRFLLGLRRDECRLARSRHGDRVCIGFRCRRRSHVPGEFSRGHIL